MKKLNTLFVLALVSLSGAVAFAQQPPAATPAPAAAGATPARPPRPQVPPATGAMLDIANQLADAINKQDAAALQKMMADDAVYLDEDGHAPAVSRWITALTSTAAGAPAKKIEISTTHGQSWEDYGWVSFNYVIAETINGEPKSVRGTASLMARKASGGDWKIQVVHGALYQKVAGLTDAK
jgi:ketosteroid isomerase-like protein